MKIETKYEIGTHIWMIFENQNQSELEVFDTYITGVTAEKDGWFYNADKENWFEIQEKDIILYEDKETLYKTLCIKMETLNKEHKND